MKISSYYKNLGWEVELKTDCDNLDQYDKVTISKVFTDTPIDESILTLPNVEYGGTGFFFDEAPNLPCEIEHSIPDYHLYDEWVQQQVDHGVKKSEFKGYLDYSIGFTTRGCFRKCKFCVNQKYDRVFKHSPLEEFYDPIRKKICILDDNFLGFPEWKEILNELIATGKPFTFKQGIDERLLTKEKCDILFNCKYDGDFTFAFDNIKDYDLIHSKLKIIRESTNKVIKFYVLCGFENTDKNDIVNTFKRIKLLMEYQCLPYIMRYQNKNEKPYEYSKHRGIYITLARWCNQPSFFKKKSLREFCNIENNKSALKYMTEFENEFPEIAKEYFDLKFSDYSKK